MDNSGEERSLDNPEAVEENVSEESTDSVVSETIETVVETGNDVLSPTGVISNIFFDPIKSAKSLVEKPQWLIPFIIVLALYFVQMFLISDIMADAQLEAAAKAMADRDMSAEQIDQAIAIQEKFIPLGFYVFGPIGIVLWNLIFFSIMLFLGNIIMGGHMKFSHYWSLGWTVGVIGMVGGLLTAILTKVTGNFEGSQLALSLLMGENTEGVLYKILKGFNIFAIWQGIAFGLGLSVFTKKNKGLCVTISLLLFVGLGILGAFFQRGA